MAVTTSFTWTFGTQQFMNNLFTAGSQFGPEVAANASRSEYFGVWTDPNNSSQAEGRVIGGNQSAVSDEITINASNNFAAQSDPDVAGLAGGNFVALYNDFNLDPGGDIIAQLYNAAGSPIGFIQVDVSANDDSLPAVAAFADGGFVVTWARNLGGGNVDISAYTFNSGGSAVSGNFSVDSTLGAQTAPAAAGLAGGNFVEVWEDAPSHGVYFRRFTSAGVAVDASRVAIDTIGSVNSDIHVVALNDGGFAVAYTDNGWAISGTEITFKIFNADGSARSGFTLANSTALAGITAGNQNLPTITTLGNGMIVVGWNDAASATTYSQVFDSAGNPIGGNFAQNSSVIESDFAGLSGAFMTNVRQSTVEDGTGNGSSIRTSVDEFTRIFTGDGADDTIVGISDRLREIFNGNGGNDTFVAAFAGSDQFNGGAGSDTVSYSAAGARVTANLADPSNNAGEAANDSYSSIENLTGSLFSDNLTGDGGPNNLSGGDSNDRLTGGGGNDMIDGGDGSDIAFFGGNRAAYKVFLLADGTHVVGPDGSDLLNNVETLVFDDTAISNPQPTHWIGSQSLGQHPAGWTPSAGVYDFTGDGTADIGWFNPSTGNIDIWAIFNGNYGSSVGPGNHPLGWSPVASGDFDANGSSDIAWYNSSSGNLEIWRLNGGNWIGSNNLGDHPAGWTPKGAGDFNGDSTSDILWYNPTTGNAELWLVSGGNWAGSVDLGNHPAGWTPAGVGDFDGDGTADVLWYNPTTNDAEVWKIVGGHFSASADLGTHAAGWAVEGVGDFNGDGTSDVLWHNPTNGDVEVWRIVGNHRDSSIDIGPHPLGWVIAGVNDLNHDGHADIVWHEASTGKIDNWMLAN